jgi:predicted permease
MQDASYAFRSLRRSPGFSLFTALVIGLGVGAATAVFSVVKPLILAPLPFEEADELVWIANVPGAGGTSLSGVTSRSSNLRDFRERTSSFDGLTGYNAFFDQQAYILSGDGEPERLVGAGVANDFLDVLGVRPLHGRNFTEEEGMWGGPPAIILSYNFWRSHYDADPSIVGRTMVIDDQAREVVGVLPPTFDFASFFTPGRPVDFLLTFAVSDETDRWGNTLVIIGRLKPEATPERAQDELDAVIAGLQEEQLDRWGLAAALTPFREKIAGPFKPAFLLLTAAAGTLLLIVCVNVSGLLLARAPGRAREVAVRKAFGASQKRLARQLVMEMTGVSLLGGLVGGAMAWGVVRLVANTTAVQIPLLDQVGMDPSAFLFGTAVALLTGLLVSLVPALHVGEGAEANVLRSESRGSTSGRGGRKLREGLVVAEVALACVLLVMGGLLVRSFQAVLAVQLGFAPENTVAWQVRPTLDFESLEAFAVFTYGVVDQLEETPGIEQVGLIDALPLGRNRSWGFRPVGQAERDDLPSLFPHIVSPGYLEAMKIQLLEGRHISRDDAGDARLVILMNESGARRVFQGEPPLGQRINLWDDREFEVVGIVEDVRHLSPEMDSGIQVYFPFLQMPDFGSLDLVVRSRLPTEQVVSMVSAALREVDPGMPTREFFTLEGKVEQSVSARSFTLWILSAYGMAALLLAALGIYGVLAQSVAERAPEIGIRRALGATAPVVVKSVLGRTLFLAGLGILVGGLASLWIGKLLASLLFGVGATDPVTYASMGLVLILVAALAGLIPAMRAVKVRGASALQSN